jgi:polyhydroxybutyrate depolymerase
MMRRGLALATVLFMLAVPAVAVLAGAASHYFANRTAILVTSMGQERRYILHVPKRYDPAKPTPLVISLHGGMNWPAFHMKASGWNRLADEHGFIVAYPGGEGTGPGIWAMRGRPTPSRMPDVVFISELIDKLSVVYNIDPARIYANGFSNGGGMSFTLACTLSHRIAAVGLVGPYHTYRFEWCRDAAPVPSVTLHGTADHFALYEGGDHWIGPLPTLPIRQWTAMWAQLNRCAPVPIETAAARDVERMEYVDCANDAAVVLYTIKGGGHTWPGGTQLSEWMLGPTTRSIDTTRVMWDFFKAHPRR